MSMVAELEALAEVPVSDSIARIAAAMSGQPLMSGVAEPVQNVDAPGGPTIEFLVGKDRTGASWLYLYTSEEAMIRGGLAGSHCVTMRFEDLFNVARTQGFGGFIVDSHADGCLTVVPAEYFDEMSSALAART